MFLFIIYLYLYDKMYKYGFADIRGKKSVLRILSSVKRSGGERIKK